MPALSEYKDMPLWQRSMRLAADISQLSLQLPINKLAAGTQLQEAALAIPVSLARGSQAGRKAFMAAVISSRQTAAEIETLLILMQNLYNDKAFQTLLDQTAELQAALEAMARRLVDNRPAQDI